MQVARFLMKQQPVDYTGSDLAMLFRQVSLTIYQFVTAGYCELDAMLDGSCAADLLPVQERREFLLGLAYEVRGYIDYCGYGKIETAYQKSVYLELIARNGHADLPFSPEDERTLLMAAPAALMCFGNEIASVYKLAGQEALVEPRKLEMVD